jgi:hypothetical protein
MRNPVVMLIVQPNIPTNDKTTIASLYMNNDNIPDTRAAIPKHPPNIMINNADLCHFSKFFHASIANNVFLSAVVKVNVVFILFNFSCLAIKY